MPIRCVQTLLLLRRFSPETKVFGHRVEGSVAVTGVEGGSAWNAIPERCEATVDEP